MLCSRRTFVGVMFVAMLIHFITMLLVYKIRNNGNKFYRRKFMWAADEKLIINELGPYCGMIICY